MNQATDYKGLVFEILYDESCAPTPWHTPPLDAFSQSARSIK
jgi:hypothetical protein